MQDRMHYSATGPQRFVGVIFEALSAVGGGVVIALMTLIGADIIGRSILNQPVRGVAEIASLSIVAVVFLQLPQAIRGGRMLRSDGLTTFVGVRFKGVLSGVNALLTAVLLILVFYFGIGPLLQSWRINEYVGALGDFTAPLWPVRLAILIGCFFGAAYTLTTLVMVLRSLIDGPESKGESLK